MSKEIKVGKKCKQIKVIEKYHFDYVGEEFDITDVNDDTVLIENYMGKGGIDKKEFDTYFEIIEEKQQYQIGDKIKIIDGLFKDSKLEGEIIDIFDGILKIKLSDDNIISVGINDIELIKLFNKIIHKEKLLTELHFNGMNYNVEIKIRGLRTTVKLLDFDIKGSVYCNNNDMYNKQEGINRAFKKAFAKLLLKEITE